MLRFRLWLKPIWPVVLMAALLAAVFIAVVYVIQQTSGADIARHGNQLFADRTKNILNAALASQADALDARLGPVQKLVRHHAGVLDHRQPLQGAPAEHLLDSVLASSDLLVAAYLL